MDSNQNLTTTTGTYTDGTSCINYPTRTIKRTTKTIEKYDSNGEYLGKEIITIDKEDIQIQDWENPFTYNIVQCFDKN